MITFQSSPIVTAKTVTNALNTLSKLLKGALPSSYVVKLPESSRYTVYEKNCMPKIMNTIMKMFMRTMKVTMSLSEAMIF